MLSRLRAARRLAIFLVILTGCAPPSALAGAQYADPIESSALDGGTPDGGLDVVDGGYVSTTSSAIAPVTPTDATFIDAEEVGARALAISGWVLDEVGVPLADVILAGLPGEPATNEEGEFHSTVPPGFSGTVTPLADGYSFWPPSLTFTNLDVDADDQVFLGSEVEDCETSDAAWRSLAVGDLSGVFTIEFDATADDAAIDGLTAMSSGACDGYSDMALTVRFNDLGYIDARNGDRYEADEVVSYKPGVVYHFRVVVDVPSHRYSVYVKPPRESERVVALNHAFRNGQEDVISLDHWVLNAGIGGHTVCDFSIGAHANIPPSANAGHDQVVTDSDEDGTEQVTLNGTGSSDPDGTIVSYEWFDDGTPIATGATPTITVASGTWREYALKVTDNDGDVDWDTMTVTVHEPGQGTLAGSISQYGVTWTFSQAHEVGQYVTGDWWVVGPVTVTSISPEPGGGRHGSMVNPVPSKQQAYDDRNGGYNSSLGVTGPFVLSAGESLVSTVSITSHPYLDILGMSLDSNTAYTRGAAILTCVGSAPAADAFRPPYVGADKPIYRASQLHYERLPKLPIPPSAPSLTTYERIFERPWIDHIEDWLSRAMHPADNMPNYGREVCGVVGDAGLLLCLDYSDAQKEKLLIGLVQVGIDNYHSALLNQELWPLAGGHTVGRKFPILFAGLMLDESAFLALDNYQNSEDMSTYYGGAGHELWTGWQSSGHQYASHAMYLFEEGTDSDGNVWNHEHRHPSTWGDAPFPNNGNQSPHDKHESYKRICSFAFPGQTIAARLLGLKEYWGHDAYFDYVDRWMYEDDTTSFGVIEAYWPGFIGPYDGQSAWSTFAREMYFTYRPMVIGPNVEPDNGLPDLTSVGADDTPAHSGASDLTGGRQ